VGGLVFCRTVNNNNNTYAYGPFREDDFAPRRRYRNAAYIFSYDARFNYNKRPAVNYYTRRPRHRLTHYPLYIYICIYGGVYKDGFTTMLRTNTNAAHHHQRSPRVVVVVVVFITRRCLAYNGAGTRRDGGWPTCASLIRATCK